MSGQVQAIEVKAILPTNGGCAVFLGNPEKTFVIYVDLSVGTAIAMFLRNTERPRPNTHDLIHVLLQGFGGQVKRVIINDVKDRIYFCRIVVEARNEIHERKILEIDARPSDGIALAILNRAPLLVTQKVWDEVQDMSQVLESMRMEQDSSQKSIPAHYHFDEDLQSIEDELFGDEDEDEDEEDDDEDDDDDDFYFDFDSEE